MKYFFDIPVYRLTQEQYYKDRNTYVNKFICSNKELYEQNPSEQFLLQESYGGAWNYNEIIGWIGLHFLGDQIRGEFWRVKGKHITRSRKKVFEYKAHKLASEIVILQENNSAEIFLLIKEYLSDCQEELKGRYIDTSRLDIIGEYVDWRSLIDK